jgi:hypothetical protein
MAEERISAGEAPPPASEQVHLPEPSLLPVIVALGITLAVTGVVLSIELCVLGLIITIGASLKWIRETRSDIAELPLDHE